MCTLKLKAKPVTAGIISAKIICTDVYAKYDIYCRQINNKIILDHMLSLSVNVTKLISFLHDCYEVMRYTVLYITVTINLFVYDGH